MLRLISGFLRDKSGTTSIEYAVIATGISVVIVGAVNGLGSAVKGMFTQTSAMFK